MKNRFKLLVVNKIHLLIPILLPIILLFLVEYISRSDMQDTIHWFLSNVSTVFINYLLIVMLLGILTFMINLFYGTSITIIFLTLLSYANRVKINKLSEPLLPRDFLRIKELIDIIPLFRKELYTVLLLVVPVVLILFYLKKFSKKNTIKVISRAIISTILIVIFTVFYIIQPSTIEKIYQKSKINFIIWDQKENYFTNGFLFTLTSNIKNSIVLPPKGYSKSTVSFNPEKESNKLSNKIKPNLIIVMSEAFWDPTSIKNIKFSKDPIPFFRSLKNESTYGWLLSPQFGGGTANVEFEVLTGNSMSFLPSGSIAYQQFINNPTMSIASILKKEGYSTLGIHTYKSWFYNRENVYRLLGFDSFLSSEYFIDPVYKGPFISDMEMSKMIIKKVEEQKKPSFVYAVSMQNHGPYASNRYKENTISVKGNITKNSKEILETYAQGINDADKSLEFLINHFKKSKEPTIVMFFGDHLPMLGDDYKVYKESGFIRNKNEINLNDTKKLHSVPFIIWSNYKNDSKYIDTFSTSFVGPYLLNKIGVKLPPYFNYIRNVSNNLSGLIGSINIDSKGKISNLPSKNNEKIIDKYWDMEYDELFGERYNKPITFVNEHFNSDILLKLVINHTSIKTVKVNKLFNPWKGQSAIAIMGKNFTKDSSIYINDRKIETTFGSSNLITGLVPKELYKDPGKLVIDVRIESNGENIIAKSNQMEIPVVK